MSNNHAPVAAHAPQSLPSFAQTFGTQPLPRPPPNGNANALPPLQATDPNSRSRPSSEDLPPIAGAGRKRTHQDVDSASEDEDQSGREDSARASQVKIEDEHDQLEGSPPPERRTHGEESSAAGHARDAKLSKRRRTIGETPRLNIDVRVPTDQNGGTPISPVVMGLPAMRNPADLDKVRSMISVRQQQEELIAQRRSSVSGPSSASMLPGPSSPKTQSTARASRRGSPPPISAHRLAHGRRSRPSSPTALIGPAQPPPPQHVVPSQGHGIPPTQSLPPPPISFARRRAAQLGSGKKKPADLNISPREAHTPEQLQPAIQSAPPIPHGGQSSYGRFPMSIPRLPSVLGHDNSRSMVTGQVPPTPTRFSVNRGPAPPAITVTQPISNLRKSPPTPSVPISTGLVPPTPTTLRHPPAQDKAAFLAPFELFYEALNDSRQLKGWLAEQLQRSQALAHNLSAQQKELAETVDALVEKRTAGMRAEIAGLQRRVEELEDELRYDTRMRGRRNGAEQQPYTFPPDPPRSAHFKPPSLAGWSSENDREHIRENAGAWIEPLVILFYGG
ncbi:uncharacterized protein SCHCODRAFT_02492759 [Schizophyllum commune H4-8]|uniref:uncharacterized protein n=1 Tax=Schizophyllum commune (strain H4-8 / FGSC 9210) TaxID=578458 RepID=UPI00215E6518|nr:uncharacterized protein SCHCODRAFT_02492759 [Schizophyllum commune H4-8]KAI5896663.1 hypothetical protein SCHCODRAFT_02492759 [Schizophyllum commune H4-8]